MAAVRKLLEISQNRSFPAWTWL